MGGGVDGFIADVANDVTAIVNVPNAKSLPRARFATEIQNDFLVKRRAFYRLPLGHTVISPIFKDL